MSTNATSGLSEEVIINALIQLLEEKPDNPVSVFENALAKSRYGGDGLAPKQSSKYEPKLGVHKFAGITLPSEAETTNEFATTYISNVKVPVPVKKVGEDGEPEAEPEAQPEEEEDEEAEGGIVDISGEARLFEEAGIGYTPEELHRICVSIKKLYEAEKLASARLFGKIFGTRKNYYICEGKLKPAEDGAAADEGAQADEEKNFKLHQIVPTEKGAGTNAYVYWVTNDTNGNNWVKLPDITPALIQASRQIKKYFTGNLEEPISAHPPFPGVEKHYLRAQISRIAASCTLAPKGIMKLEEEPEESEDKKENKKTIDAYETIPALVRNKEFNAASVDIENLTHWVHVRPTILHTQGRCSLFKAEEQEPEDNEDNEEGEEKPKKPVEQILPILSPVSDASAVQFSYSTEYPITGWCLHRCQKKLNTKVVNIRSVRWPGAQCVAKINAIGHLKFANVYLGYGHKYDSMPFSPVFVQDIQPEYHMVEGSKILVEMEDPTPEKVAEFKEPPPPEPEPETNDENNEDNNEEPNDEDVDE